MIPNLYNELRVLVEPSKKRIITNPKYILFMDKIIMKSGAEFLVTAANQGRVELMLLGRKRIERGEFQAFCAGIRYVVRADCFEKE
jgi:hypothetical protein